MANYKENNLFKKSNYKYSWISQSTDINNTTLFFQIFPINNKKIAVDSYRGMGYYYNPKYIVEILIKKKVDCKII